MRILKIILWTILGIFILIQFIPVTYPEIVEDNKDDLIHTSFVPADVKLILKTSCYDCHSNETRYPWYSYVAPLKWMIIQHIDEGREAMNFSEWHKLNARDKIKLLDEIAEEVNDGNMPLPVYTFTHRNATLGKIQKDAINNWTEQMTNNILGE